MTKRLEDLLNIEPTESLITPTSVDATPVETIDIEDKLEEFDKISAALPRVKGLGDISDAEFDSLAAKAEQAYDDLMDLGMNVEARYGSRIFEVASSMLKNAIDAKSAKIDKKLKMIELQLKKQKLDYDRGEDNDPSVVEGKAFIVSDRNSLLQKLKNIDK